MLGYFNLFKDKFINLLEKNIVSLVANYSLVKYLLNSVVTRLFGGL